MLKRIIILLIFIVGLVGVYWLIARPLELRLGISEEVEEEIALEEEEVILSEEEEETVPAEEPLSDRARIFYVSGKGLPTFTKATIDPWKEVKEGEEQTFSIWLKGPKGIEKVTATIDTDKEDELIELELIEGTDKEGKWTGSWTTRDISVNSSYTTMFQAMNKEDQEIKMPLSWRSQSE